MAVSEEIFDKVKDILVDALGVDDDEVTPQASLMGDLGAESIDFLDIVFRLEKAFDIKIPRGELFPDVDAADTTMVADGMITPKGIDELKTRMPHANVEAFAKDPRVDKISSLFTVEMICKYLHNKLGK